MKKSLAVLVLLLVTHLCFAEVLPLSHDFTKMQSAGTLTWEGGGTTVITPDFNYVGGTDGAVGSKAGTLGYSGGYCISLQSSGSYMCTSAAISDLKYIRIGHASGTFTNLQIWLSEDGSTYTNVSSSATYNSGTILLTVPVKGDYYVKLRRNGGTNDPFISVITYDYEPCHCLRVVSQ